MELIIILQDAPEAVIQIKGHNTTTVNLMIEFLYSGDYAIPDKGTRTCKILGHLSLLTHD